MILRILLAGLCLVVSLSASAEPLSCLGSACRASYSLTSTSMTRSYALLIVAPESGCRRVRFRIEGEGAVFLGHTPALAPGEVAVVRLGSGFSEGMHPLRIASEGCNARPALTRRVTLRKSSPDHGWRASMVVAVAGSGV
jgi:hypothetical protein